MLTVDDNGKVGGMIQYIPIEHSFAEGKDLYFMNCILVHGYKKGRERDDLYSFHMWGKLIELIYIEKL